VGWGRRGERKLKVDGGKGGGGRRGVEE